MNEIVTVDGEIVEEMQALTASSSMAVQLQKAEIDQLVATARAYPRSLKRVQSAILSMATLDEESAEECIYALPRGGKPIRGPSIRFAEVLKQAYGNCRAAARVVNVDKNEGYVEAEGVFHDLETNSASTARVRRRITDKRGKVYNDDMIIVTGNAACAIAMRNAILAGVPKPLWRKAYETVQATITGDITTLAENREKAFKALAAFGVKPEQVFQSLGVEGEEDITVDHIATLRGMYSALKNGEATVEEMFVGTVKQTSDHQKVSNPLDDKPSETAQDGRETAAGAMEPTGAETPASGPAFEQEQPSTAVNTVDGSGSSGEPVPPPPSSAAADQSASGGPEEGGAEPEAQTATGASSSTTLTDLERKNLIEIARMLVAAIGPKQEELLIIFDNCMSAVANPSNLFVDKAKNVAKITRNACHDTDESKRLTKPDAVRKVALAVGCDVSEVLP